MQSPFMSLLTTTQGIGTVIETVFENRFMHISELQKMGANIVYSDRKAVIEGQETLQGACVTASDLRAGAALVLAGLAAEGTTEIEKVYYIERGYEKFAEKLTGLGADIKYVE